MNSPNLTWYIKEADDAFVAHTEFFAGYCSSEDDFTIEMEIWNNRWNNTEDVEDVKNSKLVISFKDPESSVLLRLCSVKVNDSDYVAVDDSEFNRGLVDIGNISGQKNNGSSIYQDNFKRVSIKFSNLPGNMEGLKSMYLDLQYNNY